MKIIQFKIAQIFSNGSIFFSYKTFKDSVNNVIFLEKDLKNFYYNKKIKKSTVNENFTNYKNKYIKNIK